MADNALFSPLAGFRNAMADIKKRPKNALIDALRGGLLGATTDAVGYVPDAVADFMRPFGYDVAPQDVVGGTEWLANRVTTPSNSLAENSARFAMGMLTPSISDLARLGKAPMQEMTVYHGSPHDFDKFDMSKIGTGEGAQAYGHGLYVAESKGVAKQYRAQLSGDRILPFAASPEYEHLAKYADDFRPLAKTPIEMREWFTGLADEMPEYDRGKLVELSRAIKEGKIDFRDPGALYTVDLPDSHIANMLDWDAPLSQQPEILAKLKKSGYAPDDTEMTGGEFYRRLTQEFGGEPEDVSKGFLADGIAGIKYLDGGSRKTSFGPQTTGTRNYVVFDDKLLKILKKE